MTVPVILAVVPLGLICLAGAWFDWRFRRLPNWLSLVAALCGLAFAAASAGPGSPLWSFLAHGAIALFGGMALFALGWVGGGDAKFYAGLACWFPLQWGLVLLMGVCLAGMLELVVWFTCRRLQGKKISTGKTDPAARLPYGMAIALGAMAAFAARW